MRTINFSDARNNLREVFDRVVADADATIITRRDAEDVVVISLDTWNSWQETEYLLSSPANARRLMESLSRLNAGKGRAMEISELEDFDSPRKALGVAEEPVEYHVPTPRARTAKTTALRKKAAAKKR